MPNKDFLENYPLYKNFDTDWMNAYNAVTLDVLPKPAIHMYCESCNSDQTFNMDNDYDEIEGGDVEEKIVRANYVCSACKNSNRVFFIRFSNRDVKDENGKDYPYVSMVKVGQYPAWSIAVDKELNDLLGAHRDYYKRGLICESQSYGIGAYAYFRRIAEDIIGNLLDSITDLIEPGEVEKYKNALSSVKKTKVTEEKIDLVKDLLPASLSPDGRNPLKILHSALSAGLHGKTDEECMNQAEIIRKVLIYLVNQIVQNKRSKSEFTKGMEKILNSKN